MASKQDVIDLLKTALDALEKEESIDDSLFQIEGDLEGIRSGIEELHDVLESFGETTIDDAPTAASELAGTAERVMEGLRDTIDNVQNLQSSASTRI